MSPGAVYGLPAATAPSLSRYRDAVLSIRPALHLELYLRFQETSGATLYDEAQRYNATYAGGITLGQAGPGPQSPYSVALSGTAYIYVGAYDEVNMTTQTFAVWVKTSGNGEIFSDRGAGYSLSYTIGGTPIYGVSGCPRLWWDGPGTDAGQTQSSTVNDGAWHHLVGVNVGGATSTSLLLYVDGRVRASSAQDYGARQSTYTGTSGALIGAGNTGGLRQLTGNLSEFAIWNKALTSDEVAKLYAAAIRQ